MIILPTELGCGSPKLLSVLLLPLLFTSLSLSPAAAALGGSVPSGDRGDCDEKDRLSDVSLSDVSLSELDELMAAAAAAGCFPDVKEHEPEPDPAAAAESSVSDSESLPPCSRHAVRALPRS
jgi:hypothetical protein